MSHTRAMRRFGIAPMLAAAIAIAGVGVGGRTAAREHHEQPDPPDVQTLGPQIGERVPDFNLPDQRGDLHALASLMGPKGAILVFFRSADW